MINRVLIRIKVVQILYSYLLTRSEFKIESAPETTSSDARFAYTVYINTLLLMLELSGYDVKGSSALKEAAANKHLKNNRMARSLFYDDSIRKIILKGNSGVEDFDGLLDEMYHDIINSSIYRSYTHMKQRDIENDVKLWGALIPTVIARNPAFEQAMRGKEGYTMKGYEMGISMLLNTLNNFSDNRSLLQEARTALESSLDKAYELYNALLLLPVALTRLEEERIDAGRNKYLPTPDELNPNVRFIENGFVKALVANESFNKNLEERPVSWDNEPLFLRSLMENIRQSEIYRDYMEAKTTDYAADCDFWRSIMRAVILPSDELAEVLEASSVYWNDDLEIMGTFVLKTIKRFSTSTTDGKQVNVLPKFKDDDDARFGAELFDLTVEHREEYREYIDRFINQEQWDTERLAFMDIVVMMTAIAEIINYPLIPVPVTLNEYIEIANSYSTPKSGQFINGILYSVLKYLKAEGKIDKTF